MFESVCSREFEQRRVTVKRSTTRHQRVENDARGVDIRAPIDFASPRFGGNFINSSYGVLPNTPLPSYPAPALGAALFLGTDQAVGFRAAVYEGGSEAGSFAGHAFDDGIDG